MILSTILILVFIFALAAFFITLNIKALLYICQPNEILIFAGGKKLLPSQQSIGYRLIHGGRGIRIPLLESVHRMDLSNMIVEIKVKGAYCKGGIPLDIEAVANLKIASFEPAIHHAIERFLGKSREAIQNVARETLEGNLRGVLAMLTPEEVNNDRIKFAESLVHEADHDLLRLGLVLDTLKIQTVADDKGYLNSIGRKESARLQMLSRVAEANNRAQSTVREAENQKTRAIARVNAQIEAAKADAQRRIIEAQTLKQAMIAEERSSVSAAVAKAKTEIELQRARVEQVRLQLLADLVQKAVAEKEKQIALAQGKAAQTLENAKALSEAFRQLSEALDAAGPNATEAFIATHLERLIPTLTENLTHVSVSKMTLVSEHLNTQHLSASKMMVINEQLKQTLGLDLAQLIKDKMAN